RRRSDLLRVRAAVPLAGAKEVEESRVESRGVNRHASGSGSTLCSHSTFGLLDFSTARTSLPCHLFSSTFPVCSARKLSALSYQPSAFRESRSRESRSRGVNTPGYGSIVLSHSTLDFSTP